MSPWPCIESDVSYLPGVPGVPGVILCRFGPS
jgi:hypothetical protein